MDKKRALPDYIINVLLAGLFGWSICYALISSMSFETGSVTVLFFCIALSVFFSAVFYNKPTMLVFLSAAVLFLGGYSLYLARARKLQPAIKEIQKIYYWFMDYMSYTAELHKGYSLIVAFLLCTLVSIFSVLFIGKFFNFHAVTAFGFVLFVTQWILDFFASETAFLVFLFTIITLLIKKVHMENIRKGRFNLVSNAAFTAWSIPICLAVALSAHLIPPEPKPIEWPWLDTKISDAYNRLNDLFDTVSGPEFFSFQSTGFAKKDGSLGGRVDLDDRVVLGVRASKRVYLAGAIKDMYTGSSWINTQKEFTPAASNRLSDYTFDFLESRMGLYMQLFPQDIFDDEIIDVTFRELKTRSIFYPIKLRSVEMADASPLLVNGNGDLSAAKSMWKGFTYSIAYSIYKKNNDSIADSLRKSKRGLDQEFLNSRPAPRPGLSSPMSALDMRLFQYNQPERDNARENRVVFNASLVNMAKNRAEEIYNQYLEVPGSLPKRVKELAVSLTSAYDNNYDKVKALEKYLAAFPYTLKPKDTPKNRDFVDYFLFDLKQGYCTYYASAMAIMCRSIGIPARYVEGYITPSDKGENETYEITNQQAHAWVDVYFEGFGWITFEPTGAYNYSFYNTSGAPGGTLSDEMYEDPYYEEYLRELADEGLNIDLASLSSGKNNTNTSFIIFMAAVPLFLLVLGFLAYISANIARTVMYFNKLSTIPYKEAVVEYYGALLRLTAYDGSGIRNDETPIQYSTRLGNRYVFGSSSFSRITDIFTRARYGNKEISEEEFKKLVYAYRTMVEIIIEKHGRLRYFVARYVQKKM